jgi:methanogenic corrinoid protein MtbC1
MSDHGYHKEALESELLSNDMQAAKKLLLVTLSAMSPQDRIDNVISPVLKRIGEKWEKGEVALSQIYLSLKICEGLVTEMYGTRDAERTSVPTMAIVSLEDYHLFGVHIVRMAMQSAGEVVLDYGRMDAETLADRLCSDEIQYLLVSTLMLRSALQVKRLREILEARSYNLMIIVGGAPFRFDELLWKKVRADHTTQSPLEALEFINRQKGVRK